MTTAESYGYIKPTGSDYIKDGDDAISNNADVSARLITFMEDLAAEPGSRLENFVYDPLPADASNSYFGGNVAIVQAPGWGRSMATVSEAATTTAYLNKSGTTTDRRRVAVQAGQPVAARIDLRAMPTQKMSATLQIIGWKTDGSTETLFTSGQLDIEADKSVTFQAAGVIPESSGVAFAELRFTFRRYGEIYPAVNDFVFFRKALLVAGSNAPSAPPVDYFDGNTSGAYWAGKPNLSSSVILKPRGGGGNGMAAGAAHAALLDEWTARRGGRFSIGKKTSISFRIDHGLYNFTTKMRLKMEQLGFPYALALGSRDWGHSENAGVTPSVVNGWVTGGLAEIWSHGISHADADTPEKLYDYIVNSKAELESVLPAAAIDGFMPPGAGGTRYMGFGPSDTPQKYFDTLAGQLILQTYAIGTGQFPGTAYRVQDGRPRVGQAYFNMDTFTASEIMVRVNNAIAEGKGIQLMIHPSLIDTAGHITQAELYSLLDQIKALQDAGTVVVMSAYDQLLADSTSEYKVSQTAGRTVTVWDYLNNREQLIYGDTGWRKVDAALPAGITASNVWIRRQGSEVTINVQALRATTSGTVTIYATPTGFRPDSPSVRSGVYASSAGTARIVSPFAGNVRVLMMGAGESLDGSITFTTPDPWPTSLPGVAA